MAEPGRFTMCQLALSSNLRGVDKIWGRSRKIFQVRVPPSTTNPGSACGAIICLLLFNYTIWRGSGPV